MMLTIGFLPLLLPLAAPLLGIGAGMLVNSLNKNKKNDNNSAPQNYSPPQSPPMDMTGSMTNLLPMAQQFLPNLLPPTQPPINAPAAPFFPPNQPEPINAPAVPYQTFRQPFIQPTPIVEPTAPPTTTIFKNLGIAPALPPIAMMTTNYAVRGTDNKMRTLKVPTRPLESGESIKVRITFYAATNKAGLAGCGLDSNSSNFIGSFGNRLIPFKSVAASIGNFAGKNSKYTVSPENNPVFKKQQQLKIPELTEILKAKLGIQHDGIYSVDDTGQDVVAQVSENGANPVIDVFVPDCMDIQTLGNSIRYATATVV